MPGLPLTTSKLEAGPCRRRGTTSTSRPLTTTWGRDEGPRVPSARPTTPQRLRWGQAAFKTGTWRRRGASPSTTQSRRHLTPTLTAPLLTRSSLRPAPTAPHAAGRRPPPPPPHPSPIPPSPRNSPSHLSPLYSPQTLHSLIPQVPFITRSLVPRPSHIPTPPPHPPPLTPTPTPPSPTPGCPRLRLAHQHDPPAALRWAGPSTAGAPR